MKQHPGDRPNGEAASRVHRRRPQVVTIGGGHGQAAVLAALCELDCDISAVVSIADDGGCSGQLRAEFGMPPPGDLRRCLTTLARNRELADRFEGRLPGADDAARSAGNLALLEAYVSSGSLQAAVDWAARQLSCRGRVLPVAEEPGRLAIYDRAEGVLEGETVIEKRGAMPMVVAVHGPERSNPAASAAVAAADLIIMGPGSFITSTLATVTTARIAEPIVSARATRVLMHNLVPEPGQVAGFALEDYVRLLRDHLSINSGEDDFDMVVMCHADVADSAAVAQRRLGDGTEVLAAPLADPRHPARHDAQRVANALRNWLGFQPRPVSAPTAAAEPEEPDFEERLARALRRVGLADAPR